MDGQVYTHALWRVKAGEEDDFVAAWTEPADAFASLPDRPLWGTLIRSTADPSVFYSFGPWRGEAHVQAMRADPRARQAMARVRAHCEEATPEPCLLVRHVQLDAE
ncbi:MAG TPA: antibiotic biosynthesis monooxygenase [Longimicrobium sp.]|nr:antibiotic biosynthesis monooxygenase [Longimicrobium sp.]